MAAGRVVVLSGDSHHGVSRRGLSHLRNGTRGAKLAHRRDSGNRPRYEDHLVIQPNRGRDFGPRLCGFDEFLRVDEVKIPSFADEFHPPAQKKRKFLPILWNIEKVSKTSAKSEVPEKEASSVGAHGIVYPTSTTHGEISDSTAFLFAHLPQEDDERGEQMSEECFQARGISMSRWASDDERHGDTSSEKVVPESDLDIKGRLSLESGEFIREVPEADKDILPGSAGSSCSKRSSSRIDSVESEEKGNEVMEIDDECLSELQVGADESTEGGMDRVQCCRSIDEFEKLNRISEGTYGVVYRARDKKTGKIVALKKVKILNNRDFEEYGFPLTSLREINILASMNHPSIVNIEEVVVDSKDTVFMVMEYMDHDLRGLLDKMERPFSTSEVKCLMLQLLEGVRYLHDNWVLHRDLKTSNLLFNNQGELKICDFGMARQYGSPLQPYSTRVVTQYYRAPELLLGAKKYSTAVDMWSVGCIMAELLLKEPLFQGTNEIDQLNKIFKTLGTPNDKLWPGFSQLPGAKAKFLSQPYNLLRKKFPGIVFTGAPTLSDLGLDLMNRLLTYDPQKRISAEDALNHGWFREVPLAKCKDFMPTFPLKAY